jgi:hypothetical protein
MNRGDQRIHHRQIEFELEKAMPYDGERATQLRHMLREARKRKLSNRCVSGAANAISRRLHDAQASLGHGVYFQCGECASGASARPRRPPDACWFWVLHASRKPGTLRTDSRAAMLDHPRPNSRRAGSSGRRGRGRRGESFISGEA